MLDDANDNYKQSLAVEYNKYAPRLVLRKQTGMIVAYRHEELVFRGNTKKLSLELLKITSWNLTFGWWSRVSFLINPFLILINIGSYLIFCREYSLFKKNPEKYISEIERKEVKIQSKNNKGLPVIFILLVLLIILVGVQIPLISALRK